METDIFVGLDVSKNSTMATAMDWMGNILRQEKLSSSDNELIQFLGDIQGRKRVVLEACNVWEHIYDAAASTGAVVKMAHPLKTRIISEATLKTDKVDSEKLAELSRLNAIPEAYAPVNDERELRHIVRERIFYAKKQKDIMNHTYAVMLQRGIQYEEGILVKRKKREELRSHGIPEVSRGLDALSHMDEITKPLDSEIHNAFIKSKEARLLSTIPGVGELTAVTLAAFLCPVERFQSLESAVKYCGLCPSVYQSGNVARTGHLVWDCNPLLRWILIEAQWSTRRYEKKGDVAKVGKRVARRGKPSDGAVAAARTLLRICVAVLRRGTPYETHAPLSSSRLDVRNGR